VSDRAAFSDHLRAQAEPIWQAQLAHPFVRGIGDGTLDPRIFALWLRQDYSFLLDYARLFALAAARAPGPATAARFAALHHETTTTELDLHRAYAAEFGITPEQLAAEEKRPTTQAYTDFLLRTAALDDFPVAAAAILPCMWGYSWLGQQLAAAGPPPEARYARWVALYAAPEFTALADWCREIVDAAADPGAATRRRMEAAFLLSSRYELAFWEMAWTDECWPL
jgi:thiaminase/transcriptional activator TenA